MSVTRKPKGTSKKISVNVDDLIKRGGSIAKKDENSVNEKQVSLRIPTVMLKNLDHLLQKRTIRIPRHTWILEAMIEKIKREQGGI